VEQEPLGAASRDHPVTGEPPPALSLGPAPPPLPVGNAAKRSRGEHALTIVLSLCLGLFIADALVSLADDSFIVFFNTGAFTAVRGLVFCLFLLVAIVVYALMAFTPMVPKRLFLPVTLFTPVALLLMVPCLIFFHRWIGPIGWFVSLCQVAVGLAILCRTQGGVKLRWPFVPARCLGERRFSWRNLTVFLLLNLFVLLPACAAYLAGCAAVAVDRFSEGFVKLRTAGITMEAKKYVRADGKTVELVPMSHVGDPGFYRSLSESFPSNAVILMEGVTDERNLLTNKISYQRMAQSLGLAEQQKEFAPTRGAWVRADVDVSAFSTNTIDLLNLAMLFHKRGFDPETVLKLMQFSPPPGFETNIFADLLDKRNRHVVEEVDARLQGTDEIIVPWGAAHMAGIARQLLQRGFRVAETREYVAVAFGGHAGAAAHPKNSR